MASGQAKIDIEFGLAEIRRKAPLFALYRAYYDGIHRLTFATKDWKNEFGTIFSAFADNLCPTVIGAVRNRLSCVGFATRGDEAEPGTGPRRLLRVGRVGGEDDAADAAWAIWNRNRMDRRQKSIYKRALIYGEEPVLVWNDPDDERLAAIFPQRPEQLACRYSGDKPGEVELAVKAWIQGDRRARVNLYYEDRIERYISPAGSRSGSLPEKADRLIPFEGTEEQPEQPEVDNPIGRVPIVIFGYDSDEGEGGRSRLADVIPLQDALNKAVADMLIAGEFQAIPQRIIIGWTPTEFDADGNPKSPWKSGSDRILTLANENAKVAEWAAANLQAFIAEQDSFRAEVARVSQTPLHYLLLSGQFPSGDALDAATAPLDAVVSDTQDSFGTSLEDLLDLCARFETNAGAALTALWKPKPTTQPKTQAEASEIRKRLGVGKRQTLRELGYSDAEIDEMQEEDAEESADETSRGTEPTAPTVPGAASFGSAGLPAASPTPEPAIAASA